MLHSLAPDALEGGAVSNLQQSPKSAHRVRVAAVTREAQDILSFELVAPDGRDLPPFTAGAHIHVHLADGLVRQYSLCNDPKERHRYVIAVLKEETSRGGSRAMHEKVREGDLLTISGPDNHFPLAGREANFHLLLAGGIGVTPMMAMIAELERRKLPYRMHYCTRSPEKTAFLDRLRPLIDVGKVVLHHDGGDPSRGLDIAATLAEHKPGMHLYVCGPTGFMSAANAAVGAWPPHAVHQEYFAAPERSEEDKAWDAKAFRVRLARSGQELEVPAGESIVSVLRGQGIEVDTSCEEGYCGTCLTRYLAGDPVHRDTVLDDTDRKQYVMICCARARDDVLVLDL